MSFRYALLTQRKRTTAIFKAVKRPLTATTTKLRVAASNETCHEAVDSPGGQLEGADTEGTGAERI